MRPCSSCNRPLEEHKVIGRQVRQDARGNVHRDRIYQCDMVAISNETAYDMAAGRWVPGKRTTPKSMQRTARNPARFIHRDTLRAIQERE